VRRRGVAPPELPKFEVVIGFEPGLKRDIERLDAALAERAASTYSAGLTKRLNASGWATQLKAEPTREAFQTGLREVRRAAGEPPEGR
jgi:hypothetical protein